MNDFKVGQRVYYRRKGDPLADEGFCTILEIGPVNPKVLWEDSGASRPPAPTCASRTGRPAKRSRERGELPKPYTEKSVVMYALQHRRCIQHGQHLS
jgi:hypothetical protein